MRFDWQAQVVRAFAQACLGADPYFSFLGYSVDGSRRLTASQYEITNHLLQTELQTDRNYVRLGRKILGAA